MDDEDVELAESVDGIDVIISGHTHTFLYEPIIVNDTIIASCGEYGEYVGSIQLDIKDNGISLLSYELISIDASVPEDNELLELILPLRSSISNYLNHFGYESPEQIIAHSDFHFPEQSSMYDSLKEQQLGNLISDSYIYSIKNEEGMDYINVDVAVAPLGVIRASIDSGDISVSQIYEISSLGIGPDGVPVIPEKYIATEGRKNINDDIVLSAIFTDWGSITWIVFTLVNVIVSIIVLIVFVIIKKRRKKKRAFIALEGI